MIKITDNTIVKVFEGCKGLFEYEIILEDFSILKNNNKIKLLKNDCTLHFKSNFKYDVLPSANFIKKLHLIIFDTHYKNKKESQLMISKFIEKIDAFFNQKKYHDLFNKYIQDSSELLDVFEETNDIKEKNVIDLKIQHVDSAFSLLIIDDLNNIFN